MSWLSSALSKAGHGIQKVANTKVAGVSLGGMLGPAGQLIRGGDIKQNFLGDLKAGAKNVPLVGAGIALSGGGAGGLPGGISGSGTGGLNLGGVDLGSLIDGGLGVAGLVNASQLAKKSDDFANKSYADVRQSYDDRAPLRTAGIQGMLNPSAGVPLKLANVQANTGVGNPFAKKPTFSAGVPLTTPSPSSGFVQPDNNIVLGQHVSADQAQKSFDNVQNVLKQGGGLSKILNAAKV